MANWKTQKGIRTKVLTIEEIKGNNYPGDRLQMKIKNALKDYKDNSSILKYVLLGGDVEVVPAQKCYVEYEDVDSLNVDETPADLFYVCFNTMDWDKDGNGLYGEVADSVDLHSDLNITRIPVATTSDADMFVNRIIDYEQHPDTVSWSDNILMCGKQLQPYIYYVVNGITMSDAQYFGEHLYETSIRDYWDGDSIEFYDTGTYNGTNYDFSVQNIQTEFSKGYTFIDVGTHGNPDCWAVEGGEFYVNDVQQINNIGNSIIMTISCYTNAFDSLQTCLSEAFIRNPNSGVLGYVGSSRYGWYSKNYFYTGTSHMMNGRIYKDLFSSNEKNLSIAVTEMKNLYRLFSNDYSAYRWLLMSINPLGDAEMPIFLSKPKYFKNISVSWTGNTFTVDTGTDSCRICVMSDGDNGESYYDVQKNVSTASFFNIIDGYGYKVCVTKTGYVPFTFSIQDTANIQDETFESDTIIVANQIKAGHNVTTSKPQGPVVIQNGKTTIIGKGGVTLKNSFTVDVGACLEIKNN